MSGSVGNRTDAEQPDGEKTDRGQAHRFGLASATALIVGTIIGVGVFNLPTSLATDGSISLVSMALTTLGALALALLFAALSRRLPADGGPYACARVAFGSPLGFTNARSYGITAWAGNAAIAVGWVLYVDHFVNTGHNAFFAVLLVLIGLWIPVAINLSGVKNMGTVQVATTVVKFIAPAFMSTVGLVFISTANYTPWNVSGESSWGAIGGGMAIALFGYLGVETAAVAAAKVRDPDKNIPRATILGTLATAVVYLLSLIAVFGGTWAGNVMAVAVVISGFGALNGWTTICAEIRSPPRTTACSPSASSESGITAAIPYAFSSLAQLKWRPAVRRVLEGHRFVRDVTIAVVALVFSILFIWYSRNTGQPFWLYWAPFILAAAALLPGDPVYRSQRHRMNEPAQVPAYR